jgi:protein RecA
MAEKKTGILTNLDDTDLINAEIKKQYGTDIVVPAKNVLDEPVRIVPLSPKLDLILSGGVPDGTFCTFTGPSGCGKTTLGLHYAAKCQRPEYGSREVFYINVEGRLKHVNLKGIPGLNLEKLHIIGSHKKKILSAQEYLKISEDILRAISNCVVIIDSYSALCHENELIGDVGMSTRGAGGYTLLAQFLRQMCNVVPVMKSNVIGITHLMANVSSPYGGLTEKSGNALTFHADIRLKAKKVEAWKAGEKQIGQVITWQCIKSALGGPGGEVEGYLRYGKGIDELHELLVTAIDFGLISVVGKGWHTLNFLNSEKIQGEENLNKMFRESLELRQALETKMKEITK